MDKKIGKYEKFNGKNVPKIDDLELFAKLAAMDVNLIRCRGPYSRLSHCNIEINCGSIHCDSCLLCSEGVASDLVRWCKEQGFEVAEEETLPLFEGKAVPSAVTDAPEEAWNILYPHREPGFFHVSCSGVACPDRRNINCHQCILQGGTLRKLNRAKRWYEHNRKQMSDKYFGVQNMLFRKILSTMPEEAKADPLLLSYWLRERIDPEKDLYALIAVVAQMLVGK